MSSTQAIKLYNLLLKKGFNQEEAEAFVAEVITRDEAKETLMTKQDGHRIEMAMYKVVLGGSALTVAGVAVVLQIFFAGS